MSAEWKKNERKITESVPWSHALTIKLLKIFSGCGFQVPASVKPLAEDAYITSKLTLQEIIIISQLLFVNYLFLPWIIMTVSDLFRATLIGLAQSLLRNVSVVEIDLKVIKIESNWICWMFFDKFVVRKVLV